MRAACFSRGSAALFLNNHKFRLSEGQACGKISEIECIAACTKLDLKVLFSEKTSE
jgi:hypothetical protein